jgi:hypothetical protein
MKTYKKSSNLKDKVGQLPEVNNNINSDEEIANLKKKWAKKILPLLITGIILILFILFLILYSKQSDNNTINEDKVKTVVSPTPISTKRPLPTSEVVILEEEFFVEIEQLGVFNLALYDFDKNETLKSTNLIDYNLIFNLLNDWEFSDGLIKTNTGNIYIDYIKSKCILGGFENCIKEQAAFLECDMVGGVISVLRCDDSELELYKSVNKNGVQV